ncbi:response regulator [Natronococcus sp. JC468]|uniref:response regulator n=1 Tax=Natronococcus sp. JC468 TaxID=1961921 RepID=UPI001ADF82DF|nr:response regulator [Natronococcus sp. JC468]
MESKQFSARKSTALKRSTHGVGSEESVRVLLIENDPNDARRAQEAFESVSTTTTIEVRTDGEAALAYLEERADGSKPAPDLVLLALDLPAVDGFEFLEAVRGDEALVRIPVLVLTDSSATDDIAESYRRAANAYLAKPSDPGEFERVASAIEQFWFRRVSLPPREF